MKNVVLKIEQNGGEYYGYATIKNVPDDFTIIRSSKEIQIGDIKIEFDEVVEILKVETI
ncbi:hypothetical protein JK635_02320 [Neobacillus sp. YIM B02564]|uniref:Phage protein n=1 Tax=Neobacillus paridis TaxID=2803862 RepID=A0ABS1TME8_9BACI|nr:hypothetical protein [Neobacillus paridis]MBL4951075.1 hypothetical protein [Neobacillus paridis]